MIYICVLNYANAVDTMACCASLLRLTEQDFRILLIDNASPDGSRARLADYAVKHPDRVVFFRLSRTEAMQRGTMPHCAIRSRSLISRTLGYSTTIPSLSRMR